ncbi:MAG: hypothetical protein WBB47_11870 [Paenisporosarcina sp.]
MKSNSFLFGILAAFSLIILLSLVDIYMYNGVMNTLAPYVLIFGSAAALRQVESISWYRLFVTIAFIGGAIYLALPTYTFSEAQDAIKQEMPEVVTLSKLDNSPLENDTFNPFSPKWFYTFRVTESNGSEYTLIFNLDSGKTFIK